MNCNNNQMGNMSEDRCQEDGEEEKNKKKKTQKEIK